MPSVVLELGELEHVHDSQNLKLRTNITLSLSQLAPLSFFDFANLETLVSNGTWVAGGNRLRIHIRFIFDDIEISDYGDASIVEEIGIRLCNAEVHLSTLPHAECLNMPRSGLSSALMQPTIFPRLEPKEMITQMSSSSP